MTPSIAKPGELPNDPQIGTPEYERMQRLYTEAVERVAKLRHMETRLPEAIADAEQRCRDYAARLGLPSAVPRSRRRRPRDPDELTELQRLTLAALPGTVAEVAAQFDGNDAAARHRLNQLRTRGLAVKDPGYGGTWRRVEREEEAA